MRLRIEGLEYELPEERFRPGRSFFLPCLSPKKSRKTVLRRMGAHNYSVLVKIVIEEGVQGLRIWRVC